MRGVDRRRRRLSQALAVTAAALGPALRAGAARGQTDPPAGLPPPPVPIDPNGPFGVPGAEPGSVVAPRPAPGVPDAPRPPSAPDTPRSATEPAPRKPGAGATATPKSRGERPAATAKQPAGDKAPTIDKPPPVQQSITEPPSNSPGALPAPRNPTQAEPADAIDSTDQALSPSVSWLINGQLWVADVRRDVPAMRKPRSLPGGVRTEVRFARAVDANGNPHPSLCCEFEISVSGPVLVSFGCENSLVDLSTKKTQVEDLNVEQFRCLLAPGRAVVSHGGFKWNRHAGFRHRHTGRGYRVPQVDFNALVAAGLLLPRNARADLTAASGAQRLTEFLRIPRLPMYSGQWAPYMPGTGDRGDIGIDNEWAARWAISGLRDYGEIALRQSDAAFAFSIFARDRDSFEPIDLNRYPFAGVAPAWGMAPSVDFYPTVEPLHKLMVFDPQKGAAAEVLAQPDAAHHPDCAWIAYLTTGEQAYLRLLEMSAQFCLLDAAPHMRFGAKGMFLADGAVLQTRAKGWTLRAIARAARASDSRFGRVCRQIIADNAEYVRRRYVENPAEQRQTRFTSDLVLGQGGSLINNSFLTATFMLWQELIIDSVLWHVTELGYSGFEPWRRWRAQGLADLYGAEDLPWQDFGLMFLAGIYSFWDGKESELDFRARALPVDSFRQIWFMTFSNANDRYVPGPVPVRTGGRWYVHQKPGSQEAIAIRTEAANALRAKSKIPNRPADANEYIGDWLYAGIQGMHTVGALAGAHSLLANKKSELALRRFAGRSNKSEMARHDFIARTQPIKQTGSAYGPLAAINHATPDLGNFAGLIEAAEQAPGKLRVRGIAAPGAQVKLLLRDAAGNQTGQAGATANETGQFEAIATTQFAGGQHLSATLNSAPNSVARFRAVLTNIGEVKLEASGAAGQVRVSGTAPASALVRIYLFPSEAMFTELNADANGRFGVDLPCANGDYLIYAIHKSRGKWSLPSERRFVTVR